jgi:hypothetical protein
LDLAVFCCKAAVNSTLNEERRANSWADDPVAPKKWWLHWTFPKKNCKKMCQNLVPLVHIKIAGKWMFIPLKMVLIGIDP